MTDDILFQNGSVVVTKTLARVGGVSYPINGIGSVLVAAPQRAGLIVFTCVCVLLGLSSAVDWNVTKNFSIGCLVFAAVLALVAYQRPFRLQIRTASGDQNVLESTDRNKLEKIKSAIEQAVVNRG